MGRGKSNLERQRRKTLERRQRDNRTTGRVAPIENMPRKLAEQLDLACDLIRKRDYAAAEELLQHLDSRSARFPLILEVLMGLYQATGDHERCCATAKRLTILQPCDAEAVLIYAQESMFCGRATIARLNYERFIERWPTHEYVTKAKTALEILIPETENRIKDVGFPLEHALEWLICHEESLALLQTGDFVGCAAKCRELLAKAPTFKSARNNLAIAYFHVGRSLDAVAVAEETRKLIPDDQFALALLAKLYFLSDRAAAAQQVADQIVADPPTGQDAQIAALESLAILGRDEDVVALAEGPAADQIVDASARARRCHFLAYAKCRLGDQLAAKTLWKKCLKLDPHQSEARENLLDLESKGGHAPWANSFCTWISRKTIEALVFNERDQTAIRLARYPAIAALIPALLDRGDPLGREAAMRFAKSDSSPPLMEALKTFALGSRGPDAMRIELLAFLREKGILDTGSQRIYRLGRWTEIELWAAEINYARLDPGCSAQFAELLNEGIEAMNAGKLDLAETRLGEVLAHYPDNCCAAYNLCVLWMRRDGVAGEQRAKRRLEQLRRDFPEYRFSTIALAQFLAMEGKLQEARAMIDPVYRASKLHAAEAQALFATLAQICLADGDLDGADRALETYRQLSEGDDLNARTIAARIDKARRPSGLRGLVSKFF